MDKRHFPLKPFYLVRHGESFANRFSYPSGMMDTRLTRRGRGQAQAASCVIEDLEYKPGFLISSTLHRARTTAEAIQRVLSCPLRLDRGLAEQYYGRDQGVHKTKAIARGGPEWWRTPDQGEEFIRFRRRVIGRMAWWLRRDVDCPMFVGHSGLFTAFGDLYGNPLRNIPNAGAFLFEPGHVHGTLGWMITRFDGAATFHDWIEI